MSTSALNSYVIKDSTGLQVTLCNLGARIVNIEVPCRGAATRLVCGYPELEDYLADKVYMGTTVGPIANRIAGGKLSIAGKAYQMDVNHGPHSLHSGKHGWDKLHWRCIEHIDDRVTFALRVAAEHNALPGNLELRVSYRVANQALTIDYSGKTDANTYLNLTNHVYLNLNSQSDPINNHLFTLFAQSFARVDELQIPTGSLKDLPTPFHYALDSTCAYPELMEAADHHFIVDENDPSLKRCIKVVSPESGISVEVSSTKPGFQLYTGQFLSAPFTAFAGFCVETQFAPDAINQPDFVSPLTTVDQPYSHTSCYRFDWP